MATSTKTTSRHAKPDLETKVASLEADIAALRRELAAVKAQKSAPGAQDGDWVDREEWAKWRRLVAKKIGIRL